MHTLKSQVPMDSAEGADHLVEDCRDWVRRYRAEGSQAERKMRRNACVGVADTGYAIHVEVGLPDLPAARFCVTFAADRLVIREKSPLGAYGRSTVLRLPVAIAPETAKTTMRRGILQITAYKKRVMFREVEAPKVNAFAACAGR
jgi:HSP20 family molecular chaperone IbpA